MIIFGTRGVRSTKATGMFDCPQCEDNRGYRHRKVTQFFTLYFIPLIPLGNKGEYVECDHCKGTFITKVINNTASADKEAFMAMYEQAIRHVMVKIMLADGVIDSNERTMVLRIINKYGHNDMSSFQLDDYIKEVQADSSDISTYLKNVGPSLNEHGKELLIKCALDVAYSDGHFDDSERIMILEMGKVMEMSSAHVKGIMAEFVEQLN
ncbi:TerB family tellurite resistance protein [Flavivirga spongiicola]|uniref:TerB family tellurite resistance protein n=1 Tax=Flavivirga spongiicola TaxID=421621 RepID=A0ABU7XZR8_9FLAO|nr:TerB family tellurite resistance protein [Flavivirga sp. MEBiC05379]MDO5980958.1 TerB family tellurite resistance protein [Flavivirga sp. MEBiC05379]